MFYKEDDEFGFVNGIRATSTMLVVFLHTGFVYAANPVTSALKLECSMEQPFVSIFRAGPILLQNIFAISAFFTLYPVLEQILVKKVALTAKDYLVMLIKRIVRMLPLLAFVTLFSATVFPDLKRGPIWLNGAGTDWQICRNFGWRNLLFVNNIFDGDDIVSFWMGFCKGLYV